MTDQPYDVAASIDATYAIRQPAEQAAERECSMPGFMTCECDHITGCQYPGPPNPQPVPRGFHKGLRATRAIEPTNAIAGDQPDDDLEAARRRAVAFQTRIDAARDWARQHLEPEQQAGLLAVLRGDGPALG